MIDKFKILLLNGPNLNLLGIREPKKYGYNTLSNIIKNLSKLSKKFGIHLDHIQSNSENELINQIHKSYKKINFIIINPAAFTHTSVALRDAFLSVNIPFIEIHLSNIYAREKFRHYSYLRDIAIGTICGFGEDGYYFAFKKAIKYLTNNNSI